MLTPRPRTPGIVAAQESGLHFVSLAKRHGFHPTLWPLLLILGVIFGWLVSKLS